MGHSLVSWPLPALILPLLTVFSLPLPSLYSLPPVVPSEGMGQAGEGDPGRCLPGHVEDSEDGEAPPGPVLSCWTHNLHSPTGSPAPERLPLQVGGRV